jgi:hypothetical protein
MFKPLALAVLALAAGSAHAAGSVQVNFVKPEQFADIRDANFSRDANLAALKQQLEAAAAPYVADGQMMKIDVLDVDLAGELSHRLRFNEVRVMRGRADWPRITLRWSLEAPDRPVQSGQATVSDMAYLQHIASASYDGPLRYERRMLDDWFAKEFRRVN